MAGHDTVPLQPNNPTDTADLTFEATADTYDLVEAWQQEEAVWHQQPIPDEVYNSAACAQYVHAMRQAVADEQRMLDARHGMQQAIHASLAESEEAQTRTKALDDLLRERVAYGADIEALDLQQRAMTDATIRERAARQVMLDRADLGNRMPYSDLLDMPSDNMEQFRWLHSEEYTRAYEELRPVVNAERDRQLALLAKDRTAGTLTDDEYEIDEYELQAHRINGAYNAVYLQRLAMDRVRLYRMAADRVHNARLERPDASVVDDGNDTLHDDEVERFDDQPAFGQSNAFRLEWVELPSETHEPAAPMSVRAMQLLRWLKRHTIGDDPLSTPFG